MIVAQGQEGELGILPNHIPFTTPLDVGPLKVKIGQEERLFGVYGGFLEVKEDRIVVLSTDVDRPEDVVLEEAEKKRTKLEETLSGEVTDNERADLERRLARVKTQIKIAE
jgi:F-type H+-transporting ATPase subunit epsilon